ncbi:MAG: hypothetical protein JO261_05040 [Alphaproteobacteria bacterium]|nr:hypothetical protein [Alphaproteobacteria bacterium]MBV9693046.1 hypothetical protein [Alphaproteobacteria bacterium]
MKTGHFALAALLAAGNAAAGETVTVLLKPGATLESRAADRERCEIVAQNAPLDDLPLVEPKGNYEIPGWQFQQMQRQYGTGPSLAGAAIAAVIIAKAEYDEGIREQRLAGAELCLRTLGYVALPLTEAEAQSYRALPSDARPAWEATFMASVPAARIAAESAPLFPPLPHEEHEPFAQGGIRIVPESLAATVAPLASGDLVTGKAERVHSATLRERIAVSHGDVTITAEAGTAMYLAEFRRQSQLLLRPAGATWCGAFSESSRNGPVTRTWCLTTRHAGYEVEPADGEPWLAAPIRKLNSFPLYTSAVHLDEQPAAGDTGPLDFAIVVKAVKPRLAQLAAVIRHDGQETEIWRRTVVFNHKGEAEIALWSMRLLLSHGDGAISGTLAKDGEGADWYR